MISPQTPTLFKRTIKSIKFSGVSLNPYPVVSSKSFSLRRESISFVSDILTKLMGLCNPSLPEITIHFLNISKLNKSINFLIIISP
jgi:hypothetical protein